LCGKEISTVPQIFLDGELIGGYTELLAKLTEENSISFDIEL
jgi:glutaredoxin